MPHSSTDTTLSQKEISKKTFVKNFSRRTLHENSNINRVQIDVFSFFLSNKITKLDYKCHTMK